MFREAYSNYYLIELFCLNFFNLESGGAPHIGYFDRRAIAIQLLVPLPPSLTVMDYLSDENRMDSNSNVVVGNSYKKRSTCPFLCSQPSHQHLIISNSHLLLNSQYSFHYPHHSKYAFLHRRPRCSSSPRWQVSRRPLRLPMENRPFC